MKEFRLLPVPEWLGAAVRAGVAHAIAGGCALSGGCPPPNRPPDLTELFSGDHSDPESWPVYRYLHTGNSSFLA
jgi:hypothetical protein